jgi:signal transduction histidine kinase
MADLETRIFCRLDGLTPKAREQKRLTALQERGLLETEAIAVFDEATQTTARLLDAPICILGVMDQTHLKIKSAVGLSQVGLMNQLAQLRYISRNDSFCNYVVDTHQVLAIHDTAVHPVLASSVLVGHYGIRAYLGAPLITVDGVCLGALAVMDWEPRSFNRKDVELLAITARWSLSEFERNRLLEQKYTSSVYWMPPSPSLQSGGESEAIRGEPESSTRCSTCEHSVNSVKVKLLTQLTQALRTPLTSVMGMASVLTRQVYGPLTQKQQEYLEIIHRSGQHLVSLVDEIVDLGGLDEASEELQLTSVDIEMICQQAINSLKELAHSRQQQIRLTIEPGNRIWLLDKDKVRQLMYYLIYAVIHTAEAGSEIRVHASRKIDHLNIAVWVSHPWLSEGQIGAGIPELPVSPSPISAFSNPLDTQINSEEYESAEVAVSSFFPSTYLGTSNISLAVALALDCEPHNISEKGNSRESLGLLLSCYLAELHGGQISLQGSLDCGYRYVVMLPELESTQERV